MTEKKPEEEPVDTGKVVAAIVNQIANICLWLGVLGFLAWLLVKWG